jgi:two-component system, chemotaxis family, protein-glutamate methylesterase/glutaminase
VRIIGIGGSAGGHDAVIDILGRFTPSLDAAVLVTIHLRSGQPTNLPSVLDRATLLEVIRAEPGATIRPGQVLVAPPDHHLLVEAGRVRLDAGAHVNGMRPAVDPMFLSIAAADTAGVVVSGTRDDGADGLRAIARAGGRTLVQDPATARYPGMPDAALAAVDVDVVAHPRELARDLVAWVRGAAPTAVATAARAPEPDDEQPTGLTCPLCHGVLGETGTADHPVFRCRIGHVFSPQSLLAANGDDLEETLLTALRTMHERSRLLERMAATGPAGGADHLRTRAEGLRRHIRTLEQLLGTRDAPQAATQQPTGRA